MSVRSVLTSGMVLVAMLASGCASPCTEFPALATLRFEFEGSNATLIQSFRDLSWNVSWDSSVSSLSFFIARELDDARYKGTVHPSGIERAGAVESTIEGSLLGESNMTRIQQHLSPVIEPLRRPLRHQCRVWWRGPALRRHLSALA